ncbi:MAG: Na+/H+ antiporter NhaA [Actinobacteria bacterium]|nr:Na+/H+ antiporter NhaA [Actinomycetota bacterium]
MTSNANDHDEVVRHVWSASERFVPRVFVRPAQEFIQIEAAGGIVMLAAGVVALIWANSPWSGGYHSLWGTHVNVEIGSLVQLDHLTLRDWISDAAMAVFFFVVGLEIKRELLLGELRNPRAAALPAIAAVGGMVVPALIYLAFNAGTATSDGWGIPMATDIAFAVGVISLLGDRVPSGAKLFLLTLAIVDDLGAILVIAIFYTDQLSLGWLGVAIVAVCAAANLRRVNVRSLVPYLGLGVLAWYALLESGVHATLVGVAFGFITPAWSFYSPARFVPDARRLMDDVQKAFEDNSLDRDEYEHVGVALGDLRRLATETQSPLERLEKRLNPWVSFVVVPLFALANAGISLSGDSLSGAWTDRVVLGVLFGLVVGKTVGVFSATWLACRVGIGSLPAQTSWPVMLGVSMCAGVGFTVAMFVTNLSFAEVAPTDSAKLGVLVASLLAGIAGFVFLRMIGSSTRRET